MYMSEITMVSMVLIAYNQEQFIKQAIISAFQQTYLPMEIILSDDCSTDRTFDIMAEMTHDYHGPHKISLNRNLTNLGIAGNLNKAFEMSQGQFIVVQAGDDISVPNRVAELVQCWKSQKTSVDLVCSYLEDIDIDGRSTGFINKEVMFVPDVSKDPLNWRCGATGACAAYSRKLFEKYGPLNTRVMAEDWVYSFRAWVESGIAVIEAPLVKRRIHSASISVTHRNVKTVRDAALRRQLRRKAAENALGIAEEWLRAWQISGKEYKQHSEAGLRRLVRMRELQLCAHNATRAAALKIAIKIYLNKGGSVNTLKIIVRHVLRID